MRKNSTSLSNNVWNMKEFKSCKGLVRKIKYIGGGLRASWQRITRGYSDMDTYNMCDFLEVLIPEMIQNLKETSTGIPAELEWVVASTGEKTKIRPDEKEWEDILDRMIFLWREAGELTCSRKNPYEEEYYKAIKNFEEKYGVGGEKLKTAEDLEREKREGIRIFYTMDRIEENKEIIERYYGEKASILGYRRACKDEAMDMLKKHFYSLWD